MAMKEFRKGTNTITNRSNESVTIYLRNISNFEPLSADEEADLARIIRNGAKREAERARKQLIEANLKFVVSVANQYSSPILELSDLISEGNIGLVRAAEDFDETKGFKFITYAVWRIRQSIQDAVDKTSTTFRLPHNHLNTLRTFRRMQNDVLQKEGRELAVGEFCDITGVDYNTMCRILGSTISTMKMDEVVKDEGRATYGDFLVSESAADSSLDSDSLHSDILDLIAHCLSERESFVVKSKMGIGCAEMSLGEIAVVMGLSHERTRQIFNNALKKLSTSPYLTSLAMHLAA